MFDIPLAIANGYAPPARPTCIDRAVRILPDWLPGRTLPSSSTPCCLLSVRTHVMYGRAHLTGWQHALPRAGMAEARLELSASPSFLADMGFPLGKEKGLTVLHTRRRTAKPSVTIREPQ